MTPEEWEKERERRLRERSKVIEDSRAVRLPFKAAHIGKPAPADANGLFGALLVAILGRPHEPDHPL